MSEIIKNLKKGSLLIAEPDMIDPVFSQSVILICNHDEDGTLGLILNQVFPQTMEAMTGMTIHSGFPVNVGGPMTEGGGIMLHHDNSLYGGDEIANGIYIGTKDSLRALEGFISHQDANKNKAKIYVGYAGWGKGSLELEILDGNWAVKESTVDIVFNSNADTLWTTLSK